MYDCENKCAFSFRRNVSKDVTDVTSSGRLFQIMGQAVANERSPTVARHDGLTSRRLVVDDRRRPRRPIHAVESSVKDDRHFELNSLRCTQPVKTGQSVGEYDLSDECRPFLNICKKMADESQISCVI